MEILLPYICKWITIILVAAIIILLAKYGIHISRLKHGSTEVEFDNIRINLQERIKYGYDERYGEENFRPFRLFLGSPSGLESLREAFCEEVRFFNDIHAHKRNVLFKIEKWEDIPPDSQRSQDLINQKLIQCNCYVLILYDRWGSTPGENNGYSFSSGSEEEFYLANQWLNDETYPMEKIAVYFKKVEPEKLQSPNEQLKKVLDFRNQIEQEKKLHYNQFSDKDEFCRKIQTFMADWLDKIAPWVKPTGDSSVRGYIGRKTN